MSRLQDSRLGRSWMAIREDELAAASNGINTVTTKLLAFALGASTAGSAGVFLAAKLQTVTPNLFRFEVSFTVLAMVPALAFYAIAERQLIGGLTSGAVKG